jgi:hypothetical protein
MVAIINYLQCFTYPLFPNLILLFISGRVVRPLQDVSNSQYRHAHQQAGKSND